MMTVASEFITRVREDRDLWISVLIASTSACLVAVLFTAPAVLVAGLAVSLALAAILSFDFFVYAMIFLLPWSPNVDLDLPIKDIFLALRLVLFLGVCWRLLKQDKPIGKWIWGSSRKKIIWVYAAITFASVFLSEVPGNRPSYRSLGLLVSYLGTFYAVDGWLEDRAQLPRLLKILFVSTIGVALFGFFQALSDSYTDIYFRLYPFNEETLEPWVGRITSFLFHFNSLAGYLNLVIPFAIGCAVLAKEPVLKYLGVVCASVAAIAVVLTQSRGGILALVGIVLVAICILVPHLMTRIKIFSVSAVACFLLVPPLLGHFDRLQGVDDATEFSRLAAWEAAAIMFVDHPVVGVGYGNYRFLSAHFVEHVEQGVLEAHNLYLEILAETGILGFVAFAVLLVAFLYHSVRVSRERDALPRIVAFGVCGAIVATLIHGMVDYLFNISPQFGTLFWLVLGLGSSTVAIRVPGFVKRNYHDLAPSRAPLSAAVFPQ